MSLYYTINKHKNQVYTALFILDTLLHNKYDYILKHSSIQFYLQNV